MVELAAATDAVVVFGETRALVLAAEGPDFGSEGGALDLIGAAYGQDAELIAVPASRLGAAFFQLRTGIAGAFIQKIRNYRYRLAIVGDISAHLDRSAPLRAFVAESNRGRPVRGRPRRPRRASGEPRHRS